MNPKILQISLPTILVSHDDCQYCTGKPVC